MISLYKNIVLFSYVGYLVVFSIPYVDVIFLDQNTMDLLSWNGYNALSQSGEAIRYFFLIAYTIALPGCLLFKAWGRSLFTLLSIASLIATGISGLAILTPIENVIYYLINLADGATLILMYFSSIATKFRHQTPSNADRPK